LLCVDADSQRSFKEVRFIPVKCCISDSEPLTKDAKKCLMVDRIKCGSKIKENKRTHVTRVDRTYNLVVHGDDGGLGRVTSSVLVSSLIFSAPRSDKVGNISYMCGYSLHKLLNWYPHLLLVTDTLPAPPCKRDRRSAAADQGTNAANCAWVGAAPFPQYSSTPVVNSSVYHGITITRKKLNNQKYHICNRHCQRTDKQQITIRTGDLIS